MADISGSRTEANLRYAFANETISRRPYLACAARAEAEGNARAAALFREIADRRRDHALSHMDTLEPDVHSGSRSAYRLRAAIMDELHGCAEMYPGMAGTARAEG